MKILYIDFIPPDFEGEKDRNPDQRPIVGASIYISDVFRALLRHSSYDLIVLPALAVRRPVENDFRDSGLYTANARRLQFVSEYQLPELRHAEQLVMFSPVMDIGNVVRLRRISGRLRTPITGVIHSVSFSSSQLAEMLPFFFLSLKSFDALICSSTAGRQTVIKLFESIRHRLSLLGLGERLPPLKTPIIPLGVETAAFALDCKETVRNKLGTGKGPVVLYFGRFSATSKADLGPLLVGFAEVALRHPETVLILAGDDTRHHLATKLEDFAAELGCRNQVRVFPNPTSIQKRDLFCLADIFVSLADSLQETFGITIAEAMAAGLPVLASDWNGYKDLVVDGETGYLVRTLMPQYPERFEDLRGSGGMRAWDILAATTVIDLKQFCQMLDMLLTDSDQRLRLGRQSRERALRLFDWAVVIKKYEALWDQLSQEAALASDNGDWGETDLSKWSYLETFSHYPTKLLAMDSRIRVTDLGRSLRQKSLLLTRIAMPDGWFHKDELVRLLDFLTLNENISVEQALQSRGDAVVDSDVMRDLSYLCRLLKYGLLEVR
jgi:D-inositol-3-phosphate glycosyltransferase